MRECGLKLDMARLKDSENLSLPVRECELKSAGMESPRRPYSHTQCVSVERPLSVSFSENAHHMHRERSGRRETGFYRLDTHESKNIPANGIHKAVGKDKIETIHHRENKTDPKAGFYKQKGKAEGMYYLSKMKYQVMHELPDWRISTVSAIYIQYVRTVLKSFPTLLPLCHSLRERLPTYPAV